MRITEGWRYRGLTVSDIMNVTKSFRNTPNLWFWVICFADPACPVITLEEECCVFPFIYEGKTYYSCTTKNHDRLWCSLTANYDENKQWDNCDSEKH